MSKELHPDITQFVKKHNLSTETEGKLLGSSDDATSFVIGQDIHNRVRNPDRYVTKMIVESEKWVEKNAPDPDDDYHPNDPQGPKYSQKAHESEENPEWTEEDCQQEPALCDECQEGGYVDQSEDNPEHPRDEAGYDTYQEPEYPQFDYVDDDGNGYNDPNDVCGKEGWQEDWQEDEGWDESDWEQ